MWKRKTLAHMPPETRKLARLIMSVESAAHRLANHLVIIQMQELDLRASEHQIALMAEKELPLTIACTRCQKTVRLEKLEDILKVPCCHCRQVMVTSSVEEIPF